MATTCSTDAAPSWLRTSPFGFGWLLGLAQTLRPGISACLLCSAAAMLQLTGIPCLCQASRRRPDACSNLQAVLAMHLHPHWIQLLQHTDPGLFDNNLHPGCVTGGFDCCMAR